VACVVGPPGDNWADALRSVLPADAAGALQAVLPDADADRQFARLLAGECGMVVARGRDFGDILRGVAANRREATVLPVRASPSVVERALQPRSGDEQKSPAPQQAVPSSPSGPNSAPVLSGSMREQFVRGAAESCVASAGAAQGAPITAFDKGDPMMRAYCGCVANGLADGLTVTDLVLLGLAMDGREQGGGLSALVTPAEAQRLREWVVRVTAACLARPTGER
jgi:hypothetical protein